MNPSDSWLLRLLTYLFSWYFVSKTRRNEHLRKRLMRIWPQWHYCLCQQKGLGKLAKGRRVLWEPHWCLRHGVLGPRGGKVSVILAGLSVGTTCWKSSMLKETRGKPDHSRKGKCLFLFHHLKKKSSCIIFFKHKLKCSICKDSDDVG